MLQSKTLPLSLQHTDTEPVQPPPVSVCLRAQRSKSVGDHMRFLSIAVSRVLVGSWQSHHDLHRVSAGWPQVTRLASLTAAPHCKQKLQRQLPSRSLWRNVPFPKDSSLKAAKKQDESWLKAMMFCYNSSPCLTSEGNESSLSLKSRYKALRLSQLHFSLVRYACVQNAQEEYKAASQTSVTWTLLLWFALQAAYPLVNTRLFQQTEEAKRQVLHLPAQENLTRFQTRSYSWTLEEEYNRFLRLSSILRFVSLQFLWTCAC